MSLRKVSDVPVGVFLSGGLDSSTNAALFSEGETSPVKTFSIGYDRRRIARTRTSCRTRGRWPRASAPTITSTSSRVDDIVDFLPRMVQLQDEPIGDPVCVPLYYVAKLARDNGVIVCQLGEGADELFIGYPSWLRGAQAAALGRLARAERRSSGWLRRRWPRSATTATVHVEWLRRGARGEPLFWSGAEAFTDAEKRRLLSPRLRGTLGGPDVVGRASRRFASGSSANAPEPSHLNWMSLRRSATCGCPSCC